MDENISDHLKRRNNRQLTNLKKNLPRRELDQMRVGKEINEKTGRSVHQRILWLIWLL